MELVLSPLLVMQIDTESEIPAKVSSYDADPDVIIMREVAAGNDGNFAEMVDRWKGPLINFFYKSLHSFESSEELSQVVFMRIYQSAGRYEPRAKFSTYLFQIARNLLINEYRKRKNKPLDILDPHEIRASNEMDPDGRQKLRLMEFEEAIAEAMEQLPENHRTALLLWKQEGLSYDEIAETMETTQSSIKTWIFRARQQLKILLKDFA